MRAVLVAGLLSFTACLPTGVVCVEGTLPCGSGCIDPLNDKRNCGGCGQSCGANQECNAGSCGCQQGTTSCSGECVVTDSDSLNCGGCGVACASGLVCELSACKSACTVGTTMRCGDSCISTVSDVNNCGGCGLACASGQSCRNSTCTYDVVAACFSTGQLIGLSATSLSKGTLTSVGSAPQSLAVMGQTILSLDGLDRRLYQATQSSSGLAQAASASAVGAVPNQVIVDGTTAYVVNAGAGTLQILQSGVDAGVLSLDGGASGLALGTVSELNFGMNTFPESATKVGNVVFVTLYGGTGSAASAGQTIAKVLVSDPANPTEVGRVDLSTLDLHAFDGGAPVARPWSIVTHNGAVYAVLNNLNPTTWSPEGPGLLARVDPSTSALTEVALAGSDCLNPQWAQSVGGKLAVSCAGKAVYDSSFNVVSASGAGLVLLDEADQHLATWSSACPADAGSCAVMTPGRFTVSGQRVLLGDQNTGRIVVLDVSDAGLSEVRGVTDAVTTCPSRNVADLLTLP